MFVLKVLFDGRCFLDSFESEGINHFIDNITDGSIITISKGLQELFIFICGSEYYLLSLFHTRI